MKGKKLLSIIMAIAMIGMMSFGGMTAFAENEGNQETESISEDLGDGGGAADVPMSGKAWIGGTFTNDAGNVDWIPYTDQSVEFEVGKRFTAVLDYGDDWNEHEEAEWGYVCVVQTDLTNENESAEAYNAIVYSVKVDGEEINISPENIEIGYDKKEGGVRVPLTNCWDEDGALVLSPGTIGELSLLEVDMVIFLAGDPEFDNVDDAGEDEGIVDDADDTDDTDDADDAPGNVGNSVANDSADSDDDSDGEGGINVILWVIIGLAVIAVVIVIVVIANKKTK